MAVNFSNMRRYLVSVVAIGVAVLGRVWAVHMGWGPYRFPFVQSAIIVAALFGGIGPGLLAVAIGTFVFWFLCLPPMGTLHLEHSVDAANLVTFAIINLAVAWGFATVRTYWRSRRGRPSAAPFPADTSAANANLAIGRPRVLIRSPHALALLLAVALGLAAFGGWGLFTPAGMSRFDDEAIPIPLLCLGLAPIVFIFGIGFLPVFSFRPSSKAAQTPST